MDSVTPNSHLTNQTTPSRQNHQTNYACIANIISSIWSLLRNCICSCFNCFNPRNTPSPLPLKTTPLATTTSQKATIHTLEEKAVTQTSSRQSTLPQEFIEELKTQVFTHYANHENTFDRAKIHGVLHAARCVIWCEILANYLKEKESALFATIDLDSARRITALHDSGRKGNGIDCWEKESKEIIRLHLIQHGITENEAEKKSSLVIKESADKKALEYILFQSADCIDIMRPCTGRGGLSRFNKEYLTFYQRFPDHQVFCNNLIQEASKFIEWSERKKDTDNFLSEHVMSSLVAHITEAEFPLMYQYLHHEIKS